MAAALENVVKWLHSSSGRSKRSDNTNQGCYMLEHVATGRFYLGQSETVSSDVDKQLALLSIGKHPCKLLNKLYEKDAEIRLFEYPIKAKKARQALLKEIKETCETDYLCLNPRDIK
ncbi:hypothetical protein D3C81_23840 [compost metagenome]